ncbi:hypothetical protein [Arthrobacter sp. L77]|uniref:hypothetical protein n=1 Tax=Arthrobacter sp. L77 TaxID=1496689 RepID=UPI0005B843F0|nr:hypothetical protein [Arthrobacter sp. L77]
MDVADARELAEVLLDPDRQDPVVVLSTQQFTGDEGVDVEDLASMLGEDVTLWIVPNGPFTMALADLLPPRTQVFSDALRVYPAHLGWLDDPYQSPLHLLRTPADIRTSIELVLRDVEECLSLTRWGKHKEQTGGMVTTAVRSGLVGAFLAEGSRAVIALDDGGRALIRQESLVPEVPTSWLLSPGQRVSGVFDPATNELRCALLGASGVAAHYPDGSLALGLVTSMSASRADIMLFPGAAFPLTVADVSTNDMDTLEDLLTLGEVLIVRIDRDAGRLRLTMLDVDDDERVVPPPVLVAGGTPWLEYGRNLPSASEARTQETDTAGAGAGVPTSVGSDRGTALRDTQIALEAARAEIGILREERLQLRRDPLNSPTIRTQADADSQLLAGLEDELIRAERYNQQLQGQIKDLNDKLSGLRRKLRSSRSDSGKTSASPAFLTAAAQLEHDLYLAWVERIPATEKATHPLGRYRLGQEFVPSLALLASDKRRKALKAVVDLLSAFDGPLQARDPHPLRVSSAGDSPTVMRAGGAESCWRLSVEQGAEAARRLHYWRCADGLIELSRVVVHEDFRP